MKKQSHLFINDKVLSTEQYFGGKLIEDQYNSIKYYNGLKYTGMEVGGTHKWHYDNGVWTETKISPDKWGINFTCTKNRFHESPLNSGASLGSGFHWYIIADQQAVKTSADTYDTIMNGLKFKVGHKRPNWNKWSYNYNGHPTYKETIIAILESVINSLKES